VHTNHLPRKLGKNTCTRVRITLVFGGNEWKVWPIMSNFADCEALYNLPYKITALTLCAQHCVNSQCNFISVALIGSRPTWGSQVSRTRCSGRRRYRLHQKEMNGRNKAARHPSYTAEQFLLLLLFLLSQAYFDMDMSYTRVLHIKVAYRVPHKWRHAFYVTRPLLGAHITCYVTVITRGRCYAGA
jgi:hypothetical protein